MPPSPRTRPLQRRKRIPCRVFRAVFRRDTIQGDIIQEFDLRIELGAAARDDLVEILALPQFGDSDGPVFHRRR